MRSKITPMTAEQIANLYKGLSFPNGDYPNITVFSDDVTTHMNQLVDSLEAHYEQCLASGKHLYKAHPYAHKNLMKAANEGNAAKVMAMLMLDFRLLNKSTELNNSRRINKTGYHNTLMGCMMHGPLTENHVLVANILIAAGIDLTHQDAKGHTALQYAEIQYKQVKFTSSRDMIERIEQLICTASGEPMFNHAPQEIQKPIIEKALHMPAVNSVTMLLEASTHIQNYDVHDNVENSHHRDANSNIDSRNLLLFSQIALKSVTASEVQRGLNDTENKNNQAPRDNPYKKRKF